jgi:hypothetical protein
LFAEVKVKRNEHVVYAVLWPERNGLPTQTLHASLNDDGELTINRPDGVIDTVRIDDAQLVIK